MHSPSEAASTSVDQASHVWSAVLRFYTLDGYNGLHYSIMFCMDAELLFCLKMSAGIWYKHLALVQLMAQEHYSTAGLRILGKKGLGGLRLDASKRLKPRCLRTPAHAVPLIALKLRPWILQSRRLINAAHHVAWSTRPLPSLMPGQLHPAHTFHPS